MEAESINTAQLNRTQKPIAKNKNLQQRQKKRRDEEEETETRSFIFFCLHSTWACLKLAQVASGRVIKTGNTWDGNTAQVKQQVATVRQMRGDRRHDCSVFPCPPRRSKRKPYRSWNVLKGAGQKHLFWPRHRILKASGNKISMQDDRLQADFWPTQAGF